MKEEVKGTAREARPIGKMTLMATVLPIHMRKEDKQ